MRLALGGLVLAWGLLACGDDDGSTDAGVDAGADATSDVALDTADTSADVASIQIISINDFHGRLEPGPELGGAAFMAAHIAALEAEQPNTLFVSAGDLIGGSGFISGALLDEPTITVMNAMGLDIAGDGNHEHDRPIEELVRVMGGAEFAFLSANMVDDEGEAIFEGFAIEELDGVRVGFIGLTYTNTPRAIVPRFAEGITFLDEVETINALVPVLRDQGVETIVVVIHQGLFVLDETCLNAVGPILEISAALDDAVDVLINGHTHASYVCELDGRLVTSAGELGQRLGVISLGVDRETGDVVSASAELRDVTQDVTPDAAIEAMLAGFRAELGDPVIGSITESLTRERSPAGQSALGSVIADGYLAANPDADVAFMNVGGLRTDLLFERSGDETEDGQIRISELFEAIPFSNQLVTFEMTGAELIAFVELTLEDGITQGRDLLPSAGFELEYDLDADPRVIAMRIGGADVESDTVYRVILNDFTAGGYGDAVPPLEEAVFFGTDLMQVRAYVEANTPLSAPSDVRLIDR